MLEQFLTHWALLINRLSDDIDDASQGLLAHRHLQVGYNTSSHTLVAIK